jgi:hypothetical protein
MRKAASDELSAGSAHQSHCQLSADGFGSTLTSSLGAYVFFLCFITTAQGRSSGRGVKLSGNVKETNRSGEKVKQEK